MPKSVAIRPRFAVAIALRCSYNLIVLLYTIAMSLSAASETLQSNLNVYNSAPPNLISLKRCAFAFRLCILPRDRTKRTRGMLKWYCGRSWPRGWWCVATLRIGCGEIRPLLLMSEWWCRSESCRNRTYAEAAALPPNAAFSDKVILSVRNASQRHTNTEAHNKTQTHRKLFRASITWCLACHQACPFSYSASSECTRARCLWWLLHTLAAKSLAHRIRKFAYRPQIPNEWVTFVCVFVCLEAHQKWVGCRVCGVYTIVESICIRIRVLYFAKTMHYCFCVCVCWTIPRYEYLYCKLRTNWFSLCF